MLKSATLLSRLKDEVNELIPECAIQVGSESPAWNNINAVNVERLRNYLSRQYPEAGARYWRTSGWRLLIWQPIYLAVIAAHKCQVILPLNEMGQDFPPSGVPSGVLFGCGQIENGQINDCIQQMAEGLIHGCHDVYARWQGPGLTQKSANCVIADCVLSALLLVYPEQVDAVEDLGDQWLTTMGLLGSASFIRYENRMGETRLALNKKNCCFKYLCHGRVPCDVCPRQTMDVRIQRLSEALT